MFMPKLKTPGATLAAAMVALLPISAAVAAPPAISAASPQSPALAVMTPSGAPASRGDTQVRAIQAALNKDGASLEVDGVYGPLTERALLNYQSANHLPITGKIDQATEHSLHLG